MGYIKVFAQQRSSDHNSSTLSLKKKRQDKNVSNINKPPWFDLG